MIKSISFVVFMVLSVASLVHAGVYTVSFGAQSGTYTAADGQIQVSTNYQAPTSGGGSSSQGSTVSNTAGFLQIDFLQLQEAGVTLNQITIGNANGALFDFYGSETLNEMGNLIGRGQTFAAAAGGDSWPIDPATGSPYRYISITNDDGVTSIDSITVTVSVTCTCSSATTPAPGNSGIQGDPQFAGLQGQHFQFHGMADETFSLISSPELRVNSLFKYIASGSCTYNDTQCWTHPGTYLEQIAISFGRNKILLKSGSHASGMSVYVNGKEMTVDANMMVQLQTPAPNSVSALIKLASSSLFTFETELFYIRIHNSDYFFNFDFGLKDASVLTVGSKPLTISGELCEKEASTHLLGSHELHKEHSAISQKLAAVYPDFPLHGLVGQTWRNAQFCGRYFEGQVDDYVTGKLFANPPAFNFFKY